MDPSILLVQDVQLNKFELKQQELEGIGNPVSPTMMQGQPMISKSRVSMAEMDRVMQGAEQYKAEVVQEALGGFDKSQQRTASSGPSLWSLRAS